MQSQGQAARRPSKPACSSTTDDLSNQLIKVMRDNDRIPATIDDDDGLGAIAVGIAQPANGTEPQGVADAVDVGDAQEAVVAERFRHTYTPVPTNRDRCQ